MLLLPLALAADPAHPGLTPERRAFIDRLEADARDEPRPEQLLMLAELWLRVGEDDERAADAAHIAAFDRCHDAPGCDPAALVPDLSAANAARAHAIVRYKQLLARFPDADVADQAAYGLGFAWHATGEDALAEAAFTWLGAGGPEAVRPKEPPRDPEDLSLPKRRPWQDPALRTRAWLMAGEIAFERWDNAAAIDAYRRAAEDRRDPLHTWALHRLAWSYYRRADYARAIDTMREVVANPDHGVDLREVALKDILRFYADAGELDEAYEWGYRPLGKRKDIKTLLVHLADIYVEQGKWESAIQTWRRLIAEDPKAADAPSWEGRILETFLQMGKLDDAASEVDRLERMLGEGARGSAAYEHGLCEVGFALHRQGRDSSRLERIAVALRAYDHHRELFPEAEHAPEVAWARAWALAELGRKGEAREAFVEIVRSDPTGRFARDAAIEVERLGR